MPGAGVHRANASRELRELAIRLGAPVATAVTGAGSIAADDDWCAGSVVAGRPEWTALFAEADAVVVVGSRLDDVGTARWTLPLPNLVHIDVDPAAIDRAYPATVGIVGDARLALRGLLDELGSAPAGRSADPDWGVARARAMREAFDAGVAPDQRAVRDAFLAARAAMPRDAILTHDAARAELVERLFLAGLRARRIDLAVGLGDARLRARRRERRGRRGPRPAGRGDMRRRRLPVHRDASSRRRPRTAST